MHMQSVSLITDYTSDRLQQLLADEHLTITDLLHLICQANAAVLER